jgi:hypothetical protein
MKHFYCSLFMLVRRKEWGNYSNSPSFFYSVRLIRAGKVDKEGEKAILDEILSLANGKTLRGIINFHPILTDHVERLCSSILSNNSCQARASVSIVVY